MGQRKSIYVFESLQLIRSPLKQLARSHYQLARSHFQLARSHFQLARSHYLFIIWSLQASSCSKAFNCATKAITITFSMRSCRKVPFSIHSKIFLMNAKVDEILNEIPAIFVLGCCSIRKVVNFFEDLKTVFISIKQSAFFWNRWTASASCCSQSDMTA